MCYKIKKQLDNQTNQADELRKVGLTGDYISLNILERVFNTEAINVFSEVHCEQKIFFMKSIYFGNLDEKELMKKGNELPRKVNSVCSFVKSNYIPVKICDVFIGDCGYMFLEDRIELRDDLYIVENGEERDLDEDIILEIYSKINKDNLLSKIMILLFDKGTDWVNLYRIIDCFEGKELISNKWVTENDLKLLKHTANSPGAIGNEARHGAGYNEPPKKPMSLRIAQEIVKKIIFYYIESLDECNYGITQ